MQISAPMLMLSHPHTILSLRDVFRSIKYGARVKCFVAHGLVTESSKGCRHQVPSLYMPKDGSAFFAYIPCKFKLLSNRSLTFDL